MLLRGPECQDRKNAQQLASKHLKLLQMLGGAVEIEARLKSEERGRL